MKEPARSLFWLRFRSVLFYVVSGLCALPFLLFLPVLVLPVRYTFAVTDTYLRLQLFLLRGICGIEYQVFGKEHLPKGSCLIASQHESSWETLFFQVVLDRPVMFAKKEVFGYPIIGLTSRKLGHIPVDRQGSVDAVRQGFEAGRDAVAQGRKLLIFPTGTRRQSGEAKVTIHSGVGVLYQLAGVSVVPVLVNSGESWPSSTLVKYPGKISVRILPQIPAGLDRREFLERIENQLNQDAWPTPTPAEKT